MTTTTLTQFTETSSELALSPTKCVLRLARFHCFSQIHLAVALLPRLILLSHSISLWHSMCRFTPNKSTCTRIFISAHSASLPFLHPLPSISRCICCCCCSLFSLVHIESLRVFNLQSHYQMRNMEMRIITSNTDSLNH